VRLVGRFSDAESRATREFVVMKFRYTKTGVMTRRARHVFRAGKHGCDSSARTCKKACKQEQNDLQVGCESMRANVQKERPHAQQNTCKSKRLS
jgi:hypothetical protein